MTLVPLSRQCYKINEIQRFFDLIVSFASRRQTYFAASSIWLLAWKTTVTSFLFEDVPSES